jgi:adenylosuccinate synthase
VPVYEYLDSWKCDISGITSYDKLPAATKRYIDFIEEQLGNPVTMVSNGPRRSQLLIRKPVIGK